MFGPVTGDWDLESRGLVNFDAGLIVSAGGESSRGGELLGEACHSPSTF